MVPALPARTRAALDALLAQVLAESQGLAAGLHPLIVGSIARLMVKVNSYYTNQIEGNPSKLRDIEAALARKISADRVERNWQLEHVAHIEVERAMTRRLENEPGLNVCSAEFARWLHAEFFGRLPEESRVAKTMSGALVPVVPGELRGVGITIGRHEAPETKEEISGYLRRFEELLSPERLVGVAKVLGMAAAHHRFLWIHPFPEGNGRVGRLMTTAYGHRVGVGRSGLWTPARAFARGRDEYNRMLAHADLPRRNALDGRGPLSEEALIAFCEYFLGACLDQIRFMNGMLNLADLKRRYERHLGNLVDEGLISKSGAKVMRALFSLGEVPRGAIKEICGVAHSRASQITRELVDAAIARSETAHAPLRLEISAETSAALFPDLA